MPLFFGSSSSSVKPQHLVHRNGSSSTADLKDSRGAVVKLQKLTVTIERKLAEGGFAIIYLVSDKSNRQYALKRQFISDDQRQLEACKRECCIVSCLEGHKNIVHYVDHLISRSRSGIYEYSLLTAYYKTSVLQLMNDRLMSGRCLSAKEILSIFCDMCEAVARLHHSQTPVIHRDLKVENILIDDTCRSSPPRYVLCDFGSATTKVLSLETHSRQFIEDEILRFTTLSYRAPEMIDIYAGRPIGTKSDIWALGVLLYKLCYFALPFGESSLAVQNCSYAFPAEPEYPDELRAIIKALLQTDIEKRPDIYQVSCLAFEAAGQRSPVGNLHKVRRIPLSEALVALRDSADANPQISHPETVKANEKATAGFPRTDLVTTETSVASGVSTSVNPRLRPKPSSNVIRNAKLLNVANAGAQVSSVHAQAMQSYIARQNSMSSPDIGSTLDSGVAPRIAAKPSGGSSFSASYADARVLGFKDLDESDAKAEAQRYEPSESVFEEGPKRFADPALFSKSATRDSISMHLSAPQLYPDGTRANTFPVASNVKPSTIGGFLKSSAFKPYSETSGKLGIASQNPDLRKDSDGTDSMCAEDTSFELVASTSKWNPFIGAPFDGAAQRIVAKERGKQGNERAGEHSSLTVDEMDPFGAAPFSNIPLQQRVTIGDVDSQQSAKAVGSGRTAFDQIDSAELNSDGSAQMQRLYRLNYEQFRENSEQASHATDDSKSDNIGNEVSQDNTGSDWSSEDSKSVSSNQDKDTTLQLPIRSRDSNANGEILLSSHAFPQMSASSSTAPLLSCSSFSLKSAVTPAATSPSEVPKNTYEAEIRRDIAPEENITLHETNPFVNMESLQQDERSSHVFVPYTQTTSEFSVAHIVPAHSSSGYVNTCTVVNPSQSSCDQRERTIISLGADHGSVPQYSAAPTFTNESVVRLSSFTPSKNMERNSLPLRRDRLPSAGSSHSSDDSPQIDESGDKMLLRDARCKSSHSGSSSGRRKKLSHMEQYAANRAHQNQSLPAVEGGASAKHSPAMKKHSRKHSGPPIFKRSTPGALDAASFVNTSFQAEDWDSRPRSPTRPVLPQHI